MIGLSEAQIANAIAMAAVSDASCSRSHEYALAYSPWGRRSRAGYRGMGINHRSGIKIDVDWDKQGYEGVTESTIKKYDVATRPPRT